MHVSCDRHVVRFVRRNKRLITRLLSPFLDFLLIMATGYGPSSSQGNSRQEKLVFDGDERKFELWRLKFLGYLKIKKLKHIVCLADGAVRPDGFNDKNELAFAELIQCLDDRSLSLVMRDAEDDGRKALKILEAHYSGTGKSRVISLYTELTSLMMKMHESVTDYIIRAETASTALKNADEEISDPLLIAMVLKGLPENFRPFVVAVTQRDGEMTFTEFKTLLRSFEETEKSREQHESSKGDSVMSSASKTKAKTKDKKPWKCYNCGQPGHYAKDCPHPKKQRKQNAAKHNDDAKGAVMMKMNTGAAHSGGLLVDSGATAHIVNQKDHFIRLNDFDRDRHFIELADGTRANLAEACGDAEIKCKDSLGIEHSVILCDALYVPKCPNNIFSVQKAAERGMNVTFQRGGSKLTTPDGVVFNIVQEGKLYYLNAPSDDSVACNEMVENSTLHVNQGMSHDLLTWHRLMGHENFNDVRKLEKYVEGMHITSRNLDVNCDVCAEGKMVLSQNHSAAKNRATKRLHLVHSDLAGPVVPVGKHGFRYAMIFTDDYSGVMYCYNLKSKSDAHVAMQQFLIDTKDFGKVHTLRSDGGGEYTCEKFQDVLRSNGIRHQRTAPYSPHQNGKAERSWRTLFDMTRCLLLDSGLPKSLWCYAIKQAVHIRNRSYSHSVNETPYFKFIGSKPDLSGLQMFGAPCWSYDHVEKGKLDSKATLCHYLGHDCRSPSVFVYDPKTKGIRRSRISCVRFAKRSGAEHVSDVPDVCVGPDLSDDGEAVVSDADTTEDAPEPTTRYPRRTREPPKYLADYHYQAQSDTEISVEYCYRAIMGVPQNYEEATRSADAHEWQRAMQYEMDSLMESDTFEAVARPKDQKIIDGKWVYSMKETADSRTIYKARYVARGFTQTKGIDFHETFSPTVNMTTVRSVVQVSAQFDMKIHHLDMKSAYLNAEIDCEVYLERPKGFGRDEGNTVWKLRKSLYGLRQSGRNWNKVLHDFLRSQDFVQSLADPCLYTKRTAESFVILLIWVDDVLISASDDKSLRNVKQMFKEKFRTKDFGLVSNFLGMQFTFNEGEIVITQTRYLEKVLDRYCMNDCKGRATPCDESIRSFGEAEAVDDQRKYREMIGSLVYAVSCTRPDLAFAVSRLSQYLNAPTQVHLSCVKHVLRYVKRTLDFGLHFRKCDQADQNLKIIGYSDADWANAEDRKSVSGYCFVLQKNGPLISWKSKKQTCTALSTCESEYVALCSAAQEGLFLMKLMTDLISGGCDTYTLYCDNQSAIALTSNPVSHQRTKHIDIKFHFLRSEVEMKRLIILYVESERNVADVFTKPATRSKLQDFSFFIFGVRK